MTDVLIAADEKGKVPFLVLLDGIEDVHNMGAIIRTAECAGVDAVLLPKRRTAPINETVGKTSAGAVEYMPLVQIGNIAQTLKQLKKRGFWVIGADMDGETDYFHSSLTDRWSWSSAAKAGAFRTWSRRRATSWSRSPCSVTSIPSTPPSQRPCSCMKSCGSGRQANKSTLDKRGNDYAGSVPCRRKK